MSGRAEALAGLPDGRAFVGGERVSGGSDGMLAVEDPARGEVICEVEAGGAAEVDTAVGAAREAFERGEWGRLPARDRGHLLQRLAGLVKRHAEELAALETLDVGKPLRESLGGDLPGAIEALTWFAGFSDKLEGRTIPVRAPALNYTLREPVGVVGAVIPWNFPLLMAAWKLAPALAAGCCVVLKPAEETPLGALRLADLVREAGFPPGVVNVLPGRGEIAGRALVEHPGVDKLAFTGSTAVGREIMARCAPGLKRLSLELGGKSANIIFADAGDLQRLAAAAAFAVFYNQGQCCTAGSRVLVQRDIHDAFVERLVEAANGLVVGDPWDRHTRHGCQVSAGQLERVLQYVDGARGDGARIRAGGDRLAVEGHEGGHWMRPTVVTDVEPGSRIAQEEVFGPVACVLPFDSEEEALSLANGTDYGLAAAVWTRDVRRAHSLAARLRAGTVWINTYHRFDAGSPFGGVKASGFGRENGAAALDLYTEEKSVWVDLSPE